LPLLAIELSFCMVRDRLAKCRSGLDNIEQQTGYGFGLSDGEVRVRRDYQTLVQDLGLLQSQVYTHHATMTWCRILIRFIREKAKHLKDNLPELHSKLEVPRRMLEERAEFVLSNIECAAVYDGLKERMEAQQTVVSTYCRLTDISFQKQVLTIQSSSTSLPSLIIASISALPKTRRRWPLPASRTAQP
jgi:hypothetical protein